MKRIVAWVGVLALMLAFAWVVFKVVDLASEQRESNQSTSQSVADVRDDYRRDLKAQQDALRILEAQLRSLGAKPAVTGPTADELAGTRIVLIPGPAGPAVPFSRVLDAARRAVAQFCANDACKGDTGAKGDPAPPAKDGTNGTDGTPGKDAPVITSSYCNDNDEIVLRFSDGNDITVTGSDCRVSNLPLPDPEPDPEPTP